MKSVVVINEFGGTPIISIGIIGGSSNSIVIANVEFTILSQESETAYTVLDDNGRKLFLFKAVADIWILSDPTKKNLAGGSFGVGFEKFGAWYDTDKKLLAYRIAKNASSSLSQAFGTNTFCGGREVFGAKYRTLENGLLDVGECRKFFVWRDPISRFKSFCEMAFSRGHIYRVNQTVARCVGKDKKLCIELFANLMNALSYCHRSVCDGGALEDIHFTPMYLTMRENGSEVVGVDDMVEIHDIERYLNEIGLPYVKASCSGYAKGIITDEDIAPYMDILKPYLDGENALYEKYKGKLYAPH